MEFGLNPKTTRGRPNRNCADRRDPMPPFWAAGPKAREWVPGEVLGDGSRENSLASGALMVRLLVSRDSPRLGAPSFWTASIGPRGLMEAAAEASKLQPHPTAYTRHGLDSSKAKEQPLEAFPFGKHSGDVDDCGARCDIMK